MLKITIVRYPLTAMFQTDIDLPPFVTGCEVRTGLVHDFLKTVEYSALHLPEDFVVEMICPVIGGEKWYLGS